MTNNDLLRRIRYTFDFNDTKMIEIFASGGLTINRAEVTAWLKKQDDPAIQTLTDVQFAAFLNGFINEKRGKRDGPQPAPETVLNNNIIFRKLKIALNLQDTDIIAILKLADFNLGKHELSAFFRKPIQNQYRECQDQVLRNFIHGMQLKYKQNS